MSNFVIVTNIVLGHVFTFDQYEVFISRFLLAIIVLFI